MVRPRHRLRWRAAGYVLLELALGALLITLGAVWLASRSADEVRDAGAQATGRLMLLARGALQEALIQHFDVLVGYPPGPQPLPAWLQGELPLALPLAVLLEPRTEGAPGYLPADTPLQPVYGESLHLRIWREGDCPGAQCALHAMVHTGAPVRAARNLDYSPELVGALMLATEGFGAHAPSGAPERLRGALFDVPNPLGAMPGVVAVTASLEATPFQQFVRHGETRPVHLRERLQVDAEIGTDTGLMLRTAVVPGSACAPESLYARTQAGSLAVCTTGIWFELTRYVVQGEASGLRHGDSVPGATCPLGMSPFARVGLQALDLQITGEAIDVRGQLSGSVSGSGAVSQSGAVSVQGNFSGQVQSSADSWVRLVETPVLNGSRVMFANAATASLAHAVWGCRHEG